MVILMNISVSFIFFLQLFPKIGFYAVVVQRMSSMFMNYFIIIYGTMALPFIISFHRIVNFAKIDCEDDFHSVWQSIYSTFLLTFNMLDFSGIDAPNEQLAAMYLLHVGFVLVVGVLLINFLIALFTYHVGYVLQNNNVIVPCQAIFLMWLAEERIQSVFTRILHKLEKSYFITDSEGNIYVSEVLIAHAKPTHFPASEEQAEEREHPLFTRKVSVLSRHEDTQF